MNREAVTDRWFRYVPHAQIAEFEAAGWKVVPVGGVCFHDLYSALMEWTGPGEPP